MDEEWSPTPCSSILPLEYVTVYWEHVLFGGWISFNPGPTDGPNHCRVCLTSAQYGDFPKLGVPFGVPIIRTIVFWGLYWGPLILGNYHIGSLSLGPSETMHTDLSSRNRTCIHRYSTSGCCAIQSPKQRLVKLDDGEAVCGRRSG